MELQASRMKAREDEAGRPVLLLSQDRARWDRLLIRRGLDALARAEALGGARGRYALQAAIAACHARAATAQDTDWPRIAALYGELAQVAPSPVVELNRAVAVGMAEGPAAALAIVDRSGRRQGAAQLPVAAQCPRRPAGPARTAPTRPVASSSGPRRWPRTRGNASCCWNASGRCAATTDASALRGHGGRRGQDIAFAVGWRLFIWSRVNREHR